MTTTAAGQVELRKRYREWSRLFWEKYTTLAQIVVEDLPDPDDVEARPTRYDVDAMRDLAGSVGALVEGHERQG